jgi:hypothetical protein
MPPEVTAVGHYDLTVLAARSQWTRIRWALFAFPDIVDVTPLGDANVVRIFYEGARPYAEVWRVALLQAGFDVPSLSSGGSAGVNPCWSVRDAA